MRELRSYQKTSINEVAQKLAVHKKVIFQLATGGGKTVVLSTIAKLFAQKNNKRVLILVHRQELLTQTCKTLYDWYGIIAHEITAETKRILDGSVYVGMVETVYRRLKKMPEFGLIIIDECHIGNYFKLNFNCLTIGFSATPLSANKLNPLKNYYNDIVCGVDIPQLIKEGSLIQNITYSPKSAINRAKLKIKGGDFDDSQMAFEYSKSKNVQNTVEAYEKKASGKKAIVFNCNISHSLLVTDAFLESGYKCKHLDGGSKDRAEILRWFKVTPGAILCNVGVATTGFDEPSIECVIMNRATMSMPLWLQCTGRGARPYPGKKEFIIIDLGGNAPAHGDWCDSRDWKKIFEQPPKKSDKKGVAPIKECPKCEAILPVQSQECKFCGYRYPVKEDVYDTEIVDLILFKQNTETLIEIHSDKKDYYSFFLIGNSIVTQAKYKIKNIDIEQLNTIYQEKIKEWCRLKGKKYNQFHKDLGYNHLKKQLQ